MKKSAVFFCLLFAIGCGLGAAQPAPEGTKTIKIVPDPAFGLGVAWDSLFRKDVDLSLAFLPDGCFFLGSSREGKIYKFDAAGKIVVSFGRKGQGPGDLQGIAALDILDGSKLVVHEGMRLSLFDTTGKYLRSFSLNRTTSGMTALPDGRIALNRDQPAGSDPQWFKGQDIVYILNVGTGQEKEIASFDYAIPRGGFIIRIVPFDHFIRTAVSGSDTLVLGSPFTPEVFLYSLDGARKASFPLDIKPIEFTWDIFAFIMDFDHNAQNRQFLEPNKSKIALPKHMLYFLSLATDPEGRIIVGENHYAFKTRDVSLRVYSREGKLLSRVRFDSGPYEPVKPLYFRQGYAYGWLTKKDGDGTFVFGRWKIGL